MGTKDIIYEPVYSDEPDANTKALQALFEKVLGVKTVLNKKKGCENGYEEEMA
jgi:hypothetical protein